MATENPDVVIVGGGIVGIATAYFLGRAGVRSTVVERDAVGSHASGFAFGGLSPLAGSGIPGPAFAVAAEGMRLHRELSQSLPQETGVNTEYRDTPNLALAFTEREVQHAKAGLAWQQAQRGYDVRWVEADQVQDIDRRISHKALGGVYVEGTAHVEPYRFVLALTHAAEKLGATIRHGTVTGIKRTGHRARGVLLENGEIECNHVVLAVGPWSGAVSSWLDVPIEVRPLKGQILRLRAPGAPFPCSVGWEGNYFATKPDGLLWAGTTEEEAGFDAQPTTEGRDQIMASLLKVVPSMADAQLVHQTACLRPLSTDGLPVLGSVPGSEGVYVATGAGRKGILLGPAMGRITADLIATGSSDIPIDAFDPGRFKK